MSDWKLRVLLIEDNPGDARLVTEHVHEAASTHVEIDWVDRLAKGLSKLRERRYDAVLLDLLLPDNMGPDTLDRVLEAAPHLPIVVLTGLGDEELALEALRLGAQDYLLKSSLDGEVVVRSLRYAVQRNHVDKELARERSVAERYRHELGDLAKGLSRELFGPIDRMLSILEDGAGPPDQEQLDELREAATHIQTLREGLWGFARVCAVRPNVRPTDASHAFDRALAKLRKEIEQSEAMITRHPLPSVDADAAMLARVFEEVVRNAMQASGREHPKLHVEARETPAGCEITIADRGLGMDAERTSELFRYFDRSEATGPTGAGMGLAVCRKIMEAHGGSIELESKGKGKGCTVRLTFPSTPGSLTEVGESTGTQAEA